MTKGTKPILVVKMTDSGLLARSASPKVIGDNVFATLHDYVNLASQMKACSFDQFNITSGNITDCNEAAPGVIEVDIPISLTNNTRSVIRTAVTTAVQAKIGITLPGPYEQVMYVLES